ncbi:MAG: Tripartite tricarboxylate transporter family receptor [Mycobacterium sp.]|jgi:putative tricarboxylic transport membrane protein|nr:Tripartite tricarboxylate transporter family receptor [Mycobacterium sp.]
MRTFRNIGVAALSCLTLTVAACGATGQSTSAQQDKIDNLEIVVGNSPGGGYDTMARQIADVLDGEQLASGVRVMNKPGAGGTVALQDLVNLSASENTVMTTGVAVLGAVITNESPVTLQDVTPIARVLEEPMIIAVDAASPYQSITDLVEAWKADPAKVTAGGGAIGGPDYQQVMLLAQAVGIDARSVNFVSYDGGGELLPAILGGRVQFTASGYAEWAEQINSGAIRVLAVSGAQRMDAVDAPTLQEEGIDLVFTNWRGFVGAPNLSPQRRDQLADLFEDLHDSDAWQERLATNGQLDAFLAGDEFAQFVSEQQTSVEDILSKAGLR